MIIASTQQTIAIVVAVAVVLGWIVYLAINIRSARPEIGAELELAPNRKPYLDDEALEGPKLDRALRWGLLCLVVVGVGLPLYWLGEPNRQANAEQGFEERAISRGEHLFATTADGGFNCAGCHGGGKGGLVDYTITNPETGRLEQVKWQAPALDSATLRYTDDQLRFILTYGRKNTPMPAWGIEGGGPMNDQQIDDVIAYMHSITIDADTANQQITDEALAKVSDAGGDPSDEYQVAASLFDINCARCHTQGWSYDQAQTSGGGAMAPSLLNVTEQFPDVLGQIEWVTNAAGGKVGEKYGRSGQSDGRMPYFATVLTGTQIDQIVCYERSLGTEVSTRRASYDECQAQLADERSTEEGAS